MYRRARATSSVGRSRTAGKGTAAAPRRPRPSPGSRSGPSSPRLEAARPRSRAARSMPTGGLRWTKRGHAGLRARATREARTASRQGRSPLFHLRSPCASRASLAELELVRRWRQSTVSVTTLHRRRGVGVPIPSASRLCSAKACRSGAALRGGSVGRHRLVPIDRVGRSRLAPADVCRSLLIRFNGSTCQAARVVPSVEARAISSGSRSTFMCWC